MTRVFLGVVTVCAFLVCWSPGLPAQEKPDSSKGKQPEKKASPVTSSEAAKEPFAEESTEGAIEATEESIVEATPSEKDQAPEQRWPYQEPLFALYAKPQSRVRIGVGFATNPEVNSLAFFIEGAYAFSGIGIHVRMPLGYAMYDSDKLDNAFTYGDLEVGAQWLISHEEETNKHLSVGLNLIGPTSRAGEEKNLGAVQGGQIADNSNFGKRYLLAQKPFLDMGLIPKLNLGLVPYVAFGQNIGRVSLQTNFGCLILIMDNVSETIYGTDRRYGFILFYDLASPVAITQEISIVAEFNAAVALDGLLGTGFALTLGPRYSAKGFTVGLGVQLPLGVDNQPPDDDKMVGRYDAAIMARHQFAGIFDLSYSF